MCGHAPALATQERVERQPACLKLWVEAPLVAAGVGIGGKCGQELRIEAPAIAAGVAVDLKCEPRALG